MRRYLHVFQSRKHRQTGIAGNAAALVVRDHHDHEARAMANTGKNTRYTTRGGYTGRVVVIFFIIAVAYLGFRWNNTALPENSQDVGNRPTLTSDVAAVISLNRPAGELILPQILDA